MTDTAVDGRVARGNRTREAVIEALAELCAEGNPTPTETIELLDLHTSWETREQLRPGRSFRSNAPTSS